MLSRLTVSNLAVIEKAEAEFAPGLNVVTGETGAGKSVLMGALELALGGRADGSMVRDGAREARVEAVFATGDAADAVGAILEEAGLPPCEGGELIVRRSVGALGAGKVWLNDSPSTVATLKRLGTILADVHGPRANQGLLEERFQRDTLDSFGGLAADGGERAHYAAPYAELAELRHEVARLEEATGGDIADELELLRFQVAELEAADITEDDADIAERHAAAAHVGEVVEAANGVTEALGGDRGAAELLAAAQVKMRAAARHFPEAAEWESEAEDLLVRVQELSRTVADAASRIEVSQEDFEALDERLTLIKRLERKYRVVGAAALAETCAKKRERLDELEGRDAKLAELRGKIATASAAVADAGARLTKRRRTAAAKLEKAITASLRDLGFLQAKFSVRLTPVEPQPHGCDRVEYMFEPNPGESERPLAAIASSGEMARVMLAVKAVLAAHDATATLVFDEIDANVGGEAGKAVGEKLREVARHRQVVAITHLPQSAACGERHLCVVKTVSEGRTRTHVSVVEGRERVAEIARMLGGENLTSVTRKHAEELLRYAKKEKS